MHAAIFSKHCWQFGKRAEIDIEARMFIMVQLLDRHDLAGESVLIVRNLRPALRLDRVFILLPARDAVSISERFRCRPHHLVRKRTHEAIASHPVDDFAIAHSHAPPRASQ